MPFYEAKHSLDAAYYEIESAESMTFPPHVHRCYELILGLCGELELTIDGEVYTLRQGDMALIFPNQVHAFHTPASSIHRLIIFAPEVIAAFDRQHAQELPIGAVWTPGLEDAVVQLFQKMTPQDGLLAVKGVLYLICAQAERELRFAKLRREQVGNTSLLREILNYVQNNFHEECTLASLAAQIKYDMTYLSRFFTVNAGISFTSYVNQVRISHACYLLLNTDKTVLEISHECGNVSLRTFNRNFVAQMGCTPTEYRGR